MLAVEAIIKGIRSISFVMGLLVVSGVTAPAQGLQTIEDANSKLAFQVPANWKLSAEKNASGTKFSYADQNLRVQISTGPAPSNLPENALKLELVLKTILEKGMREAIKRQGLPDDAGFNFDSRPIITGNLEGVFAQFDFRIKGRHLKFYEFFANHANLLYQFSFFTEKADEDPSIPDVMNQILKSLQAYTGAHTVSILPASNAAAERPEPERNEMWYVVLSRELGYAQTHSFVETLDEDEEDEWIEGRRQEGYFITSVAAGENRWAVVMSKGLGYTDQKYVESEDFPDEFVQDNFNKDFYITSVVFGKTSKRWFVVMTKGVKYTEQNYFSGTGTEFPAEEIETNRKEGWNITHVSGDGVSWIVVMSKDPNSYPQRWHLRKGFPKEEIQKDWADGYEITAIGDREDDIVVVTTKIPQISQMYQVTKHFPEQWILDNSKKNYRLTLLF